MIMNKDFNKEFINKWEKIFNDNKYEMFSAVILYNMSCHSAYDELTKDEKMQLLNYANEFYLKDESCIDLGKITDTIMNNYKDVLAGKIDRYYLYEYINY